MPQPLRPVPPRRPNPSALNPVAAAMAQQGMRNPNFGTKGLESYEWDARKGLPRKENCDLSKPTEMFLWALVALPGVNGGQLVMPIAYNMVVSEHLHEVGAMLECPKCGYSKEPQKKYQPPTAQDPHWMTSPGTWVSPETPDQQPHPARDILGKMSSIQKSELLDELIGELEDDAVANRVMTKMTEKQRAQVRKILEEGE